MKRIISSVLILILLMTFLPAPVAEAASYGFSLSGSSGVYAGSTVTYTVKVKPSGGSCSGFQGKVTFSTSMFELVSASAKSRSGWSISPNSSSGTVTFVGYDTSGSNPYTSSASVLTVKLKVKNVSVGTRGEIAVTATGAGAGGGDSISATVQNPPSDENRLKSLTVDNGTLIPEFSASVYEYTLQVPFECSTVKFTAKTQDGGARVSVEGHADLVVGVPTPVTITVTAENGDKRVYTVEVLRKRDPNEPPATDNSLSMLSVDTGVLSPAFTPDWLEYVVYLPYELSTITASYEINDLWATAVKAGDEGELKVGNNPVTVTVTSEAGEARVYTINVRRGYRIGDAEAGVAVLSSLAVEGAALEPAFSPEITSYEAVFDGPVASFNVEALSDAPSVTAVNVLGDTMLEENRESVIAVTVTALDGTTAVYLIRAHIRRADSNAALSSITPSDGTLTPAFDPEVFLYTLDSSAETVTLTGLPQSEGALVSYNTEAEDYVGIAVTAEDGSQRVYTVMLAGETTLEGSGSIFSKLGAPLVITAGVVLLLFGMLFGMLLYRLLTGGERAKRAKRKAERDRIMAGVE